MAVTMKTFVRICVVLCSAFQLLVTANVVRSALIISTLMMEVILSSETSLLSRTTRRHIQEDDIHQKLHWP
jgi:hypothetical protein